MQWQVLLVQTGNTAVHNSQMQNLVQSIHTTTHYIVIVEITTIRGRGTTQYIVICSGYHRSTNCTIHQHQVTVSTEAYGAYLANHMLDLRKIPF